MLNRMPQEAHQPDCAIRELSQKLGDMVVAFDEAANVIDVFGNSRNVLQAAPGVLFGQSLFRRINVADRPAFLKAVSDTANDGHPTQIVVRMRIGDSEGCANEQHNWIEMRFARHAGNVHAMMRDMSQARLREHEIEAAHRMAAEAAVAKDRFLATVSHELRTPLNAIIGFSEILASDAVGPVSDERRKEYATIIKQSGEHLLEVVNMLLDMSKLEAGKFVVEPEAFSVADLQAGVCDMMALRAAQAGVDLSRTVQDGMPEIVSDRRALRQVLINLVSNAVKFTGSGGHVHVSTSLVGGAINITIEDDGVGIPEEELPKLGTPFFQAKSSYDRSHEGTGLGLSVVRRLVGLLGGSIRLESAIGAGTAITVRL
ncbi:MAG: sensor histidine kinase, partial [Beijerinckiaceae bacterium]